MNYRSGKVVVILGMHRSGTSMVGGILTHLGVDLGEDAPGKQESNPLGHFEDGEFLNLNEKILELAGGTWDCPPSQDKINTQIGSFSDQIVGLIQSRVNHHHQSPWGWKDPRTSLTIGFYAPFLENLHLLWCMRDSEAVAESLWKRNNLEIEEGIELARIYNQRIADFLETNPQYPVLELPYEEIIKEPEHWIPQIVNFMGLQPSTKQIEDAISFVLPKESIQNKQKSLRWKNRLSLPYRGLKRIWRMIIGTR